MSKFYITTPIYYINDKPHIGHAYSTIAADVLARYHRQHDDQVFFSTGVDENSKKTVEAAEKAGQEIQKYADGMAESWQKTWKQLEISTDRFIRTTEADHKKAVYAFFKAVKPEDIYKGTYEGWYCVACEEFKTDDELKKGFCLEHPNRKAEWLKEENHFFKLSNYQQPLLDYIEAHKDFIQPQSRRNEVKAFIESGLQDISISREGLKWGIPYPGDAKQTVYVWFDALINYLTVIGYPEKKFQDWWPADIHVVGKNIIKFHCIIWPAMLMSAGLNLPEHVFAHGFFTVEGEKMGKSAGNAIDPVELAGQYGVDALRYFLLREIPFGADGDFSHARFEAVYNSDLANELGNLVQRTAAMIERYYDGQVPDKTKPSHDVSNFHRELTSYHFDQALEEVWSIIKSANQFIEIEKPWELAKSDKDHLTEVLAHVVADLDLVSTLLLPFMPSTSSRIQQTFADGKINQSVGLLFPKADTLIHKQLDLSE